MNNHDIWAFNSGYGYATAKESRFMSADLMSAKSESYNEILTRRANTNPSVIVHPDSLGKQQLESSLRAAADWSSRQGQAEVPVVIIHQQELAANQLSSSVHHVRNFARSHDIKELDYGLSLYTQTIQARQRLEQRGNTDSQHLADISIEQAKHEIKNVFANLDVKQILDQAGNEFLDKHLALLLDAGVDISVNDLVENHDAAWIANHLTAPVHHGAQIDINDLTSQLSDTDITRHFETLVANKANINQLVERLNVMAASAKIDFLVKENVDLPLLINKLSEQPMLLQVNAAKLIAAGAKPEDIQPYLQSKVA